MSVVASCIAFRRLDRFIDASSERGQRVRVGFGAAGGRGRRIGCEFRFDCLQPHGQLRQRFRMVRPTASAARPFELVHPVDQFEEGLFVGDAGRIFAAELEALHPAQEDVLRLGTRRNVEFEARRQFKRRVQLHARAGRAEIEDHAVDRVAATVSDDLGLDLATAPFGLALADGTHSHFNPRTRYAAQFPGTMAGMC